MSNLYSTQGMCPYCGQYIEIEIDPSISTQEYSEDCQVCCRPIEVSVHLVKDGEPYVILLREDD